RPRRGWRDRVRLHLPQLDPRQGFRTRGELDLERARRRTTCRLSDLRRDRAHGRRPLGLSQHHHRGPGVPRVMSMQSLQPTPRSPSPIAREEVIALLTPALGEAPARLAVYKTCDALGFRSVELTLDEALAILD